MRLARRLSALVPLSVVAALLAPASAAQAVTTYPYVHITSPAQGAVVKGINGVTATGAVDPGSSDSPVSMTLYLNGNLHSGPESCPTAGAKTCTLSLIYDVEELTGNTSIVVTMATKLGHTATSATLTVKAYSPPPSATILSPSNGAEFDGGDTVDVSTNASIDPSQGGDNPRTMDLLVDGVSVQQVHCPSPVDVGATCPLDIGWDTTGYAEGPHTLQAMVTTFHDKTALSPLVHVSLEVEDAPQLVMTAPLDGATVTDQVYVGATGTVAAESGETPYGMFLVVDGAPFGSTELCVPPVGLTCTLGLLWDTSGLSGHHTVAVAFLTDTEELVTQAVTVTVANPLPTVTISSPAANAAVSGVTPVTATGLIDPKQLDYAKDLQLVVDGAPSGAPVPCNVASRTSCTTTFSWDASGLTGTHQLQVRFDTAYASVTSAATAVSLPPPVVVQPQPVPTTLTLKQTAAVVRGAAGVVHGLLTNAATHAPVGGAAVHVVFTPLHGAAASVDVLTAADGTFGATDPSRLLIAATVLATTGPDLGSASATETLTVKVVITCHAPKRVHHGLATTVICSTPGLVFGSVVTLHWAKDGHGTLSGKVAKGAVRFSLSIATKGWISLWATTATTHSFVASQSRDYAVNVR